MKVLIHIDGLPSRGLRAAPKWVSDKPQVGVGQTTVAGRFVFCLLLCRPFLQQCWCYSAQAAKSANPQRGLPFKGSPGSVNARRRRYITGWQTYKFIRFGAMVVTKPSKSIGFGAMAVTKPYKFIGFGAMASTSTPPRLRLDKDSPQGLSAATASGSPLPPSAASPAPARHGFAANRSRSLLARLRIQRWGSLAAVPQHDPKSYKFIWFGDSHGPKPYEFIGFGDSHGRKPYEIIGFGGSRPTTQLQMVKTICF